MTVTTLESLTQEDSLGNEARADLYGVLANERRRIVLDLLAERSGTISIGPLARRVTTAETGKSPEELEDDRIESVQVALHHVHLPKLTDVELVEYDADAGTVRGLEDGE